MSKTAIIHARIEPRTKSKAERVLKQLGLSPAEAIRLFYRQIDLHHGLPFPLLIPNERTRKTLEQSRKGEDVESFPSPEKMFESWEK